MTIAQITIDLPQGAAEAVDAQAAWYEPLAALYLHYPVIAVLLTLIGIDILTGIAKALVLRELSSVIGSKGMYRKCMTMGVVAVAWLFEAVSPKVGGLTLPWGQIVAGWFCIVEAMSIIENAGRAGVPIPKRFMQEMQRLRDKEEAASGPPLVSVNINEGGGEAVKSAIQQGAKEIRSTINAASNRAHVDATDAKQAIERQNGDSKVTWDSKTNRYVLPNGQELDPNNPDHASTINRVRGRLEAMQKRSEGT